MYTNSIYNKSVFSGHGKGAFCSICRDNMPPFWRATRRKAKIGAAVGAARVCALRAQTGRAGCARPAGGGGPPHAPRPAVVTTAAAP